MEDNQKSFMPMNAVYDFHNLMADNNLVMIYEGEFNQDITKTVLAMTEKTFDAEGVDASVRKKVFNIMVESLQNICKHQFTGGLSEIMAVFMIGETENDFLVISGNPILNDKIEMVKSRIDQVNALDKDGLKALYKQARLGSTISEVGGAGLGFIDMARKSGNQLHYSFSPINDSISFFVLKAKISKVDSGE